MKKGLQFGGSYDIINLFTFVLVFWRKAGGANENFVRLNFFAKNKIYFRNVHILVRQGEKDHYEKEQHGV